MCVGVVQILHTLGTTRVSKSFIRPSSTKLAISKWMPVCVDEDDSMSASWERRASLSAVEKREGRNKGRVIVDSQLEKRRDGRRNRGR